MTETQKSRGVNKGTQKSRGAIKGLVGKKVDYINFYNEKIKDLSLKLETKHKITLIEKKVATTFIIFNSRHVATTASQVVHSQTADSWTTMAAPEPRHVVWKNLTIPFYQRMIRQNVVYVIVFLIVVFYMIPITLISAFTTLDKLRNVFPFLKSIED
jgi:hypothetical protein